MSLASSLPPDAATRRAAGHRIVHQIATQTSAPYLRFFNNIEPPPPPREWMKLLEQTTTTSKREALKHMLSPRIYPIPHTVATAACSCSLAGTKTGRRFRSRALNRFVANLFLDIVLAINASELPETRLSRFDLHHAHLFASSEHGLGLLFHAKEYFASSADFDIGNALGNCQRGTPLMYDTEAMAWRNTIWINGIAASLCVGPESSLHEEVLMDGLHEVCTVLEHDLGEEETLGVDVYFVEELSRYGRSAPHHRLFVVVP